MIPNTFTLSVLSLAVNINTQIIDEKKIKAENIKIQSNNSIILLLRLLLSFIIYLSLEYNNPFKKNPFNSAILSSFMKQYSRRLISESTKILKTLHIKVRE
jgi:hypothetical protein